LYEGDFGTDSGFIYLFQFPLNMPGSVNEVMVVNQGLYYRTLTAPVIVNEGFNAYWAVVNSQFLAWVEDPMSEVPTLQQEFTVRRERPKGLVESSPPKNPMALSFGTTASQLYLFGGSAAPEFVRYNVDFSEEISISTDGTVSSQAQIDPYNRVVYFVLDTGSVYQAGFDYLDRKWTIQDDYQGEIAVSPNGDTIFVGDRSGSVTALQVTFEASPEADCKVQETEHCRCVVGETILGEPVQHILQCEEEATVCHCTSGKKDSCGTRKHTEIYGGPIGGKTRLKIVDLIEYEDPASTLRVELTPCDETDPSCNQGHTCSAFVNNTECESCDLCSDWPNNRDRIISSTPASVTDMPLLISCPGLFDETVPQSGVNLCLLRMYENPIVNNPSFRIFSRADVCLPHELCLDFHETCTKHDECCSGSCRQGYCRILRRAGNKKTRFTLPGRGGTRGRTQGGPP